MKTYTIFFKGIVGLYNLLCHLSTTKKREQICQAVSATKKYNTVIWKSVISFAHYFSGLLIYGDGFFLSGIANDYLDHKIQSMHVKI